MTTRIDPVRRLNIELTAQPFVDTRTTVLLLRHAETDAIIAQLSSRLPGIRLNATGRAHALRLSRKLARVPLSAVYSSPRERAVDTAAPIAAAHDLPVHILDGLDEVDFGDWSGLTFDALAQFPAWREYNERRAAATVPNGESPQSVSARIFSTLTLIHHLSRGAIVAAVTHAEVIRYAVLNAEGRSIDEWQQVEVRPGSVTALSCAASGLARTHLALGI